jgi:hypothetical protein
MAGFLVKLPNVAVEQLLALPAGPIVETAAKLVTFIAVVCFASFMYAMWLPKAAVATKHPGGHRLQPPPAVPQKKKNRAKKNKKARTGGLSKVTFDVEVPSDEDEDEGLEEGLDFVTDQADAIQAEKLEASFDEQVLPMPHDIKEIGKDEKLESIKEVIVDKTFHASGGHDKGVELVAQPFNHKHKSPTSCGDASVDEKMQEQAIADDQMLRPTEVEESKCGRKTHQTTTNCEICDAPHMLALGCAETRKYTSSLLLLHRELHLRAARGPPGLPKPAEIISPTKATLRCKFVSEIQARS